MKKFSPIIPLILLIANSVFANSNDNIKIINQRLSAKYSPIPTYIEFDSKQLPLNSDLNEVFKSYWKNTSFSFQEIGEETDKLGMKHIRYNQVYNNIPIEFAQMIAHTKEGEIHSLNGEIIAYPPVQPENVISEELALNAAINHIGAKVYKWQIPHEEEHLKRETSELSATYFPQGELVFVAKNAELNHQNMRLAYKFNVYAHEPLSRFEIYVDASNEEILFQNSLIHTGNTSANAVTAYSGNQTITSDSVNSTSYRLRQTLSGGGVNTFNMQRGTNHGNAVDFIDSDNLWNNVNANLDQYATDAHFGAEQTYDYFFSNFNRNSINNNGFVLNSYVHYGTNFVNAFWDGQRMTYGDGNFNVTPLVALDIAGHEIAHGLTTFSANLLYQSQSGALNESFSDIFGAAVEFYARPSNANWTIGEDIGFTLRSMSNPNAFNDPDTYGGFRWLNTVGCTPTNQNDLCGVHRNSGVQNFWFYLLTTGGTGTNDNNDSYSVNAIGIDTAAAIAYRNLTVYLTRLSDYQDARFYSIQAAIDLYGPCSTPVQAVTNAWHAVGVGARYIPGVISDFTAGDTSSCHTPYPVSFQNNSNNGVSFSWDFGNGLSSTARNPNVVYSTYGQFDVKLVVDGGLCGTDSLTKQGFINVDTSNVCSVRLLSGNNPIQTDCLGKLFDSGGGSGNYGNNENGVITIAPSGAASVSLTFNSIDIEAGTNGNCNFDYLEIFDGSNINSPSLAVICNGISNLPSSITSTTGAITLQFVTDGGLTLSGFDIDWVCNPPTSKPDANFISSNDSTCLGSIQFQDRSTNAPNAWIWDFGDSTFSTLKNPSHEYLRNGSYTVQLITSNSFGSDTVIKTNLVHVNRPIQPSVINDTICGTLGNALLSASGNGTLRWYSNAQGGVPVITGPSVQLNNLSQTTSLWVEDFIEAPIEQVGPATNTIGGGANFNNFQYLIFDVLEVIELVSVRVYAVNSGNRTIELRDANGIVLQTLTRFVSNGMFRVNLNFKIEPGTNYQLGVSQSAGAPSLYRNNNGVSYPYTINGKVSIKNSSAGANFYYFFYNWRIKSADCLSPRTEVKAVVDTLCNIVGIDNQRLSNNQVNIFPNPASSQLTLEFLNYNQVVNSIKLIDISGKTVYKRLMNQTTNSKIIIDLNDISAGVYFLQIQSPNELITRKVIIKN